MITTAEAGLVLTFMGWQVAELNPGTRGEHWTYEKGGQVTIIPTGQMEGGMEILEVSFTGGRLPHFIEFSTHWQCEPAFTV